MSIFYYYFMKFLKTKVFLIHSIVNKYKHASINILLLNYWVFALFSKLINL